jgi:hypothetical protein
MAVEIAVRGDGLERVAAVGVNLRLAAARAGNRTLSSRRTLAVRALAENTGLAQKDIRPGVAIEKMTVARLEGKLRFTGRRIPLIAFGARQTRHGVSYRLPGGRGQAPHAFLATMRSGHHGVFQRTGGPRLPIVELFGPSLPHVVQKSGLLDTLGRDAMAEYQANFRHEVDFLVRQGRPAGGADE